MNGSDQKQAFLILAHNNPAQLKVLLSLLDHSDVDIFLHIDRKAKGFTREDISLVVKRGHLYWVKSINVNWGGYSIIKAEMLLLQEALLHGPYYYYHLLSGMDLPLKPITEVLSYFYGLNGAELISVEESTKTGFNAQERIGQYHFLQDRIGRNHGYYYFALEFIERCSLTIQRRLHVNRLKNSLIIYKGAQWFSITDRMAQYILERKQEIHKRFKAGIAADELFVQTIVMESPYFSLVQNNTMRKIDWTRGRPYTWREQDFNELIQSDKLFARKFDESVDNAIIDNIYSALGR